VNKRIDVTNPKTYIGIEGDTQMKQWPNNQEPMKRCVNGADFLLKNLSENYLSFLEQPITVLCPEPGGCSQYPRGCVFK
jgi:hypothetical protein